MKKSRKLGALACAAILTTWSMDIASAATMETVVQGIVANQTAPDHVDRDGANLFPNLTDSAGNFTGAGKSFTFSMVWDSDISSSYYYDQAATPGVPAVSGISTDALAPSSVIQSANMTVDGQIVAFGNSPSFFTINQYAHNNSQEYLLRLDSDFDPNSIVYLKGAGIDNLPTSIFGAFSNNAITQGYPSYGYLSLIKNGLKTEFGLDILSITVGLLNNPPPGAGTGGTGGTGGAGGVAGGGGTGGTGGSGGNSGGGIVIDPTPSVGGNGTEVPIPAALPLLASAIGGFAALGRRRRNSIKCKSNA